MPDRRTFLKSLAVAVGTAHQAPSLYAHQAATGRLPAPAITIKKSILISLLPKELPYPVLPRGFVYSTT